MAFDGDAAVHGIGRDALTFNHAGGQAIRQVMIDVAKAADLVLMPAGCPVCVMREDMIGELPAQLQDNTVVVRSGAECWMSQPRP